MKMKDVEGNEEQETVKGQFITKNKNKNKF